MQEVSTDNLLGINEAEQLGHSEGRMESQSPACEFRPDSKSPEINFGVCKCLLVVIVLEMGSRSFTNFCKKNLNEILFCLQESLLPECEMKQATETPELEFNPKSEVENFNFETKESSVIGDFAISPELACEYSHVPEYCDSTSQNIIMAGKGYRKYLKCIIVAIYVN